MICVVKLKFILSVVYNAYPCACTKKQGEIYKVLKQLNPVEFNNHTAKFYYNIPLKISSARLY